MRAITVTLLAVILLSCSKNESTPSTTAIIGKWHMEKYVDWRTVNGSIVKDSATLDPLGLLAEFKTDSTVYFQERNGTVYLNSTENYRITGNTMYLTNRSNPTGYDTLQILSLTSNQFSYYKKTYETGSSLTMTQSWEYWVKP
jgi:hypothetical protein